MDKARVWEIGPVRDLHLFDCNCVLGGPVFSTSSSVKFATKDLLLERLDYYGIEEALVHHSLCRIAGDEQGNYALLKEIDGEKRLHPCWVIIPPSIGKIKDPHRIFEAALRNGARAVRLFPKTHDFKLGRLSEIIEMLEEHKIPAFIDYGITFPNKDNTDWDEVRTVISRYPRLDVILVHTHNRGAPNLYPLMTKHKNLHIDMAGHWRFRAFEAMCKKFGSRCTLFGTLMPHYYASGPIAQLIYADITEEERRLMAGDNLRIMLDGVKR